MMASEERKESIADIRTRLERMEVAAKNREALFRERRQLEELLENLSGQLHTSSLETHRHLEEMEAQRSLGSDERREHLDALERQSAEISALRAKQRQVDHLLDEIEGDVEQQIQLLRSELLEAVLAAHPERAGEYRELLADVEQHTAQLLEFELLLGALQQVDLYLEAALGVWERSKRRSIWHFMFGKSPYSAITEQLGHVANHVNVTLKALADKMPVTAADPRLEKLLPALQQYLKKLSDHSSGNWRYKRFAETYPAHLDQLRIYTQELTSHQRRMQSEQSALQGKIQDWINSFYT